MAPFGLAFQIVGPISGHLSDRMGSRGLVTAGLLVSAVGLLGRGSASGWSRRRELRSSGGGDALHSSARPPGVLLSLRLLEVFIKGVRSQRECAPDEAFLVLILDQATMAGANGTARFRDGSDEVA
jgi:MFS family permease